MRILSTFARYLHPHPLYPFPLLEAGTLAYNAFKPRNLEFNGLASFYGRLLKHQSSK